MSVLKHAVLFAFLALACHNSDSPTAPGAAESLPHGTLNGTVTIGPNCPVETTNPCPTPPSAYALRKVLVFDESREKVIATVDIDEHGFYRVDLVPAKYVVDLMKTGADKSPDVPANVTIQQNVVTKIDINIDTGLR
jgi:hypothetical protein